MNDLFLLSYHYFCLAQLRFSLERLSDPLSLNSGLNTPQWETWRRGDGKRRACGLGGVDVAVSPS